MACLGVPLFAGLAKALDKSRGCLRDRETVEAVTIQVDGVLKGVGALHPAAGNGRLPDRSWWSDKTHLLHAMYVIQDTEMVGLLLAKGAYILWDTTPYCCYRGSRLYCIDLIGPQCRCKFKNLPILP
ncbi:hypothetical protein HU200_043651 [Digitaria exilis]|uniref:Uncharacterized protein n=1 Tax=Digitaria exilis TaxID=1010633 RepID=A0A835EDN5_9POAL|nr:hypothetical protein HU200_043651 [Digitaria exilis]